MTNTTILDAALDYARRGWAVHPVNRKKEPTTDHGFYDATTDEATIRDYFKNGAQVSLRTGETSGVFVLDVDLDQKKGINGYETLAYLEGCHGSLPRTPHQRTGRGGTQYLFRYVEGLKCTTGKIGTGIDTRGEGGYAVVAPSRNQNGPYEWIVSPEECPLADVPQWIIDALAKPDTPQPSTNGHAQNDYARAWSLKQLSEAIARVATAQDGTKHDTLRDMARWMGGLVPHLSESEIETALYAAIESRAANTKNARQTILDGIAHGKGSPIEPPDEPKEPTFDNDGHVCCPNCDSRLKPAKNGNGWRCLKDGGELCYWWQGEGYVPPAETEQANVGTPQSEGDAALCSDLGNARRLVAQHGADLRYVHEWDWLAWNGRCWAIDTIGETERRAKATAINIYQEAADAPDHLKQQLARHAIASQSSGKLASMISLATSEKEVRAQVADFDSRDWLLTCANGTLDLRTGKLRDHNRADMLTKAIDVPYDPAAAAPRWTTFLDRIFAGNAETIGYVQRVIGYCLTGSTGVQAMFIAHGTGANGKSVLLDVIRTLLGSYARNADSSTFLAQASDRIRSDLARLAGVRFVSTIELDEGRRLSEALVKQVTGGDPVTAAFKYQNEFEFMPKFKLLMATNHKPIIRGTDYAIWRRIRLIPFTVTIPEAERDPQLAEKLKTELPGILAWAVRGCLDWQQHGMNEPDNVRAATTAYRAEMDVIGQFIDECCIQGHNVQVPTGDLYAAYAKWAEDGGERPVTQRRFGAQMTERGFDRDRACGKWVYFGIGLLDTRHTPPASEPPEAPVDPFDPFDLNSGESPRGKNIAGDPPKLDQKDQKDHAPREQTTAAALPPDPYSVTEWMENPPRFTVTVQTEDGPRDLPGDYATLDEARAAMPTITAVADADPLAAIPAFIRDTTRMKFKSTVDANQEDARRLCEQYGLDFDATRRAVRGY